MHRRLSVALIHGCQIACFRDISYLDYGRVLKPCFLGTYFQQLVPHLRTPICAKDNSGKHTQMESGDKIPGNRSPTSQVPFMAFNLFLLIDVLTLPSACRVLAKEYDIARCYPDHTCRSFNSSWQTRPYKVHNSSAWQPQLAQYTQVHHQRVVQLHFINSFTLSHKNIISAYCPFSPAPTLTAVMNWPHARADGDFGTLIGFNGSDEAFFFCE